MKNKILVLILIVIVIMFFIGVIMLLNKKSNTSNSNISNTNDVKHQEGDINMSNMNNENSSNILFDFETKTVKLNSGYEMPILGLGTWTQNDEETANSVYYALEDGYRLIDTAQYYGNIQ